MTKIPSIYPTLQNNAAAQKTEASSGSGKPVLSNLCIMLVDDNHETINILSILLETLGCEVHPHYDGKSALSSYKKINPNVFIFDINLPDISGYELLKTIKQDFEEQALNIALTGYSDSLAKEQSKKAGFNYHLCKPVNMNNLIEVLTNFSMDISN